MSKKSDFIGIIPSRYGSTRFPGKPLALIDGVMMMERVYRQASKALERVVVATDDSRIYDAVKGFGGEVVMTSSECRNGTERVAEAYKSLGVKADVVINIQGDEPYIHPDQISAVMALFQDTPDVQIGTLAHVFDPKSGLEAFLIQTG